MLIKIKEKINMAKKLDKKNESVEPNEGGKASI